VRISLIVALAENGVIGRDGDLPWRLSADLRRFKSITMGHHIVMGRKTYESINRLLPGRTTVILTRTGDYQVEGAIVADSLDAAIGKIESDDEVFIIGGAEVYRQSIDAAERLYVTAVQAKVDGDTLFPDIDWRQWRLLEEEPHSADEKNEYDFCFRVYERIAEAKVPQR
jgi:dihydrofolate reductase